MGYRLEMSEIKYKACGSKLYGYCETSKLKSYQWLLSKGYLDGIEDKKFVDRNGITFAECNGNPQIIMRKDDFKEFIKLYNEDLNEHPDIWVHHEQDWLINKQEIKDLIENADWVLLEWY